MSPWHLIRKSLACFLMIMLIMLIILMGPPGAQAQKFQIFRYEEKDDLPSLMVTGVSQDQQGRMVFATRTGLVRYDGINWEVLDYPSHKTPRSFRHLAHDEQGKLWALEVFRPFLLTSFDGKGWTNHHTASPLDWGWDVLDMAVSTRPDGSVVVGLISHHALAYWDGNSWLVMGPDQGLRDIRSLVFLNNKVLVACSAGLIQFDPETQILSELDLEGMPKGPLRALTESDGLWLVGDDWVGSFREGIFSMLGKNLDLELTRPDQGSVAQAGPAGGLFFGGPRVLYHFHPQRGLRELGRETGLVSQGATDLFLDREKNIWITNKRGISKLVGMRLESFEAEAGMARNEVSSIIKGPDGNMILGHEGALTYLGENWEALDLKRNLPGNGRVIDMALDPHGNLWFAADEWGLARVDRDRQVTWFSQESGLPRNIYALHFDSHGQLWVGGSEGLFRRQGASFEAVPFDVNDSNIKPFVRRIDSGFDGSLLISTGMMGILHFRNGQFTGWTNGEDALVRSCYGVMDRGREGHWIATSAGLCRVQGGKLVLTSAPDPVIRGPIYSMMKDDRGRVWFGTAEGAHIWDGNQLAKLGREEGLQGQEFNRDALVQTEDGRVWMGTDRGLNIYDPLFDFPREAPPIVSVQAPWVDGIPTIQGPDLELEASHYELTIPFSGISFLNEKGLQFRTWLEGFEPVWQPYQKIPARRIRYTNLEPGEYHFHLQARNSFGVESEIVVHPSFRVKTPVTGTWWFILLETIGGLILVAGVVFFLLGRRYQSRLKNEVLQRTFELRLSEEAVRSESTRLSSILASISDGVLALDEEFKVVLSNPMAHKILHREGTAFEGQSLERVMPVEPPLVVDGQLKAPRQEAEHGPGVPTFQLKIPGLEKLTLEVSLAPLVLADDQPQGWVLAFKDVTNRQRLEREMMRTQQLESLGVLAGGIAHDFNNLLTIMLGNLSLVEKAKGFGQDERFRLERMKKATMRARGLAEQLLTFAKGGEPVMQAVDLGDLVEQATGFALSGSRVTSHVSKMSKLWPVLGDPGQLTQVVNNLVINAMQAMPEGGAMELILKNLEKMPGSPGNSPCVCLEVKDRGGGIEPAHMDSIFNPYFSTKGTGSGLGLTIVHSIVSHHGGQIQTESRLGQGTVFRVILPAGLPQETETTESRFPVFPLGLKVLVLDDEKDVLLLAEQMLIRLGLQFVGVVNGEAAVEAYALALGQNRPFTVFIADLTIPGGMGGVEAFRKIRAMDDSVVGIVFSGYSNDPVMANYSEYGFDAAIRKPFEMDRLAEVLAGAIKSRSIRKR